MVSTSRLEIARPRPDAAEFARMAGIGLHEFLENFLALCRRHAHAGVAHFKAQDSAVLAHRPS